MNPNKRGSQSHIENVRLQIQLGLVESHARRSFLPNEKLEEIFSPTTIQRVIENLDCDKDELISLPRTIRDGGRKVLAMLIWCNRLDLIVTFRNYGFLDHRLPLEEDDAKRLAGDFDGIELARRTQWIFCPYVFPEKMWEFHRQIDRRVILPFTKTELIGDGAFGMIDKISISPSQQHFMHKVTDTVQVARKRLKVHGATPEYRREKSSIRLLNQLRHPNIIPFLGSYTYGDENFFLFRYMDLDLCKFLHLQQRYRDFQNDCTFYSALAGLASALANTHNLDLNDAEHDIDVKAIGYHHDIRPPNILVGPDTFVLADFGLGKVKPEDAPSHTPYKSISGDYVAPECTDMDENPNTVNRAIDVWAFGCLLFEVVTSMLKGVQGIEEFRTKRNTPGRLPQWEDSGFYQPQGEVKDEVRQWKEKLIRDHPDSGMTAQLLEVAMDALNREPGERPTMDIVCRQLAVISMRKYFKAVQETLRKAYEPEKQQDSDSRLLESLRYAQARFNIWGDTLSLSGTAVSDHAVGLSDKSVDIMKEVLRLPENTDRQNREYEAGHSLLLQHIERLWELMPTPLRQSADARWSQKTMSIESIQRPQDPHPTLGDNQSVSVNPAIIHRINSEFEKAALAFKGRLPKSVPWNKILEIGSADEFYTFATRIQEQQSQAGGLRNLAKMELYLQRLETFGRIIRDTISEHRDVLAAIWGPIALLLQWAKDLDRAYDALLGALDQVGQNLPKSSDFEVLPQNSEMQEVMLLFFKDLLNIYHEILEPLSHRDWMHVFEHLWPKHDANIREIGRHIERLGRMMGTEIRLEHIQQEHEFRNTALRYFKDREMAATQEEFNRIMTSFGPKRYDHTLYRLRSRHYQGTSNWLFSETNFSNWLKGSREESRILWIKGIPGAGKTFLSGAVVDLLRISEEAMTAFVFLTYTETETSALSTIHSLVFQLAEKSPELKEIVCQSMNENLRSDIAASSKLLSDLIIYTGSVYVVIDGVDEISEFERRGLLKELLKLSRTCQVRILLSSRSEADIVHQLANTVATVQVDDHNEASIGSYVHHRAQEIFIQRKMARSSRERILNLLVPLASRAKGMFLFARLVMSIVTSMGDFSDMEEGLKVLPENLDDAYRRIINRLVQIKDKKEATRARRLLGWIASSPHPISIEGAQQAVFVVPQNRDQIFDIVSKLDVVKMLGPIVETVDNYIHFVHFTAKEYISSDHLGIHLINPTQATLDLAVCCMSYLCQRHHDSDLKDEEIALKACSGQYSFHAFSSKMWFPMVCQYLRLVNTTGPSVDLIQSIQGMCDARKMNDIDPSGHRDQKHGKLKEDSLDILKDKHQSLHEFLLQVSQFRQNSYLFTGTKDRDPKKDHQDPLSISVTSQRIRQAIDGAVCKAPTEECSSSSNSNVHERCEDILLHYGPQPFRCKFPSCNYWEDGFPTRGKRDQHELLHDTLLQCDEPGCEFQEIGFLSNRMRQEHFNDAHSSAPVPVAHGHGNLGDQQLDAIELEAILSELVQKDQVEQVREVLDAFPNVLKRRVLRHKLQLLAASKASGDMLKLLGDRSAWDSTAENADDTHNCIRESIKSCNASALTYFSFFIKKEFRRIDNGPAFGTSRVWLTEEIISTGWRQGLEIWCKCIQTHLDTIFAAQIKVHFLSHFSGDRILAAAASHPAGDMLLLHLWQKLRVIHNSSRLARSASVVLKAVMKHNLSISLATYLLDSGAKINHRHGMYGKSALHWAASHSTLKAAEMVKFLLLRGADPTAEQRPQARYLREGKKAQKIRDEPGAQNIHQWLGKTWDELVDETKQMRINMEAEKVLMSKIDAQE